MVRLYGKRSSSADSDICLQVGCSSAGSPADQAVTTLHDLPSVLDLQGEQAPAAAELTPQNQPLGGMAVCPA